MNTTLVEHGGAGRFFFSSTVDGAYSLTIDTGGSIVFQQYGGCGRRLVQTEGDRRRYPMAQRPHAEDNQYAEPTIVPSCWGGRAIGQHQFAGRRIRLGCDQRVDCGTLPRYDANQCGSALQSQFHGRRGRNPTRLNSLARRLRVRHRSMAISRRSARRVTTTRFALAADAALTSTATGDIAFGSTVNGTYALDIHAGGAIVFNKAVAGWTDCPN